MSTPYLTAAFYQFVALPDFEARKAPLQALCEQRNVKGLILLASEGINSTIAGAAEDVHAVLAFLRSDPRLAHLQHKESWSDRAPFRRMKVRLKKEIVTMNVPGISPTLMAGTYVKPADWNALIADPDVVVVDTRNDYEVEIGSFAHAINPQLKTFAELPAWLDNSERLASPGNSGKKPKVAMFCTGGIRCEKSTAYLRSKGFEDVFHLEGGILKYLETVPPEQSLWQGECFVFDERVSVGHGLVPGPHMLCRACRQPLANGAQDSPLFELGVSCPRCHGTSTDAQKNGARERQRQWEREKAKQAGARPVLYSFRRCPYAMRARLALHAAGVQVELREIALKAKPAEMLQASPKGTLPVLVLPNGRVIEQSLDIMFWALQQNDPNLWLPKDDAGMRDALMCIADNDGPFKQALDRYKYPARFAAVDGSAYRESGAAILQRWQRRLADQPYLSGDRWGLVDAAIAPFVRQFAHTDRHWFAAQDWEHLRRWLETFETSPAFAAVMEKVPVWSPASAL